VTCDVWFDQIPPELSLDTEPNKLRQPVPFNAIFNFRTGCTPAWANEKAHLVARLEKADVLVDILGTPKNPGLCVTHYAANIEEVVDWIETLDPAPAILIASHLFGPDVMARVNSSPDSAVSRNVILMGQFESRTQSYFRNWTMAPL
jgi:hypothetical protein